MANDPHRITLDQLRDLLAGLGIEPDVMTLRTIFIEPGKVTVVRMRLDENGNSYVLPEQNEVATETVTIAVVNS